MKLCNTSIAKEAIYYQPNDAFVTDATTLIDKIYKEIDHKQYRTNYDVVSKCKLIDNLNYLIRNRFGLDCSIANSKAFIGGTAAVYTPVSVNVIDYTLIDLIYISNMEQRMYLEKHQEMLLTKEVSKSIISFKYATVDGYYSKLPIYINIDFITLHKKMKITSRELIAILLHEIGHVFMGFSYHYKSSVNNLIAATVVDELNNNNVEKAIYILNNNITDSKKKLAYTENDSKNRYDIAASIFYNEMDVNTEYRYYCLATNNEAIADNFATRFNVGKELTTSLDKMNDWYFIEYGISSKNLKGIGNKNVDLIEAVEFYSLYTLVRLPLYVLNSVFANMHKLVMAIFFIFDIYDSHNHRFTRIKQALVNSIKDLHADKKMVTDVLAQIKVIDEVISQYPVDDRLVIERVFESVSKTGRDGKYYRETQKDIELFLNNELFVHAAQLKHS